MQLSIMSHSGWRNILAGGWIVEMLRQADLRPFVTEASSVTQLALHVVTELARSNIIETGVPQRELLLLLVRFARYGDEAVMRRVQQEMRRARVSAEQVIDVYIPEAVKVVGLCWHEGELDVLQASIASARLQTLLRELGRAWVADQCGNNAGARVLLVLPRGEQHTLGAMIAANQLRRLGVSVRMQLLPSPENVVSELRDLSFDGLFLSVSNETSLESCQDLIKTVRTQLNRTVPVAVGGGIVSAGHPVLTPARVAALTGADIVTLDVIEALNFCGLLRRSEAAE
jgi:MerR family transcriptional regulator, light-induced transcriptional regulator